MNGKRKAAGPAPQKSSAARSKAGGRRGGTLRRVVKWLLVIGLVGALVVVAGVVVLYKSTDIPNPNSDFQTQTSFVYYADGKSDIGQFATQNRESITLKEMPQNIQDAVVAAENRTFWTDKGIDPKGIVRAAFSNARGNSTQGASTITQQYVKILYLTQERSLKRKAKEAILSLKIQNQLSKSQILEGYLNTIYFGRGAYGIQAAAQAYFAVDAKDLSLKQAAVLASVINNPTLFDPANGKANKQALKERYRYVLGGMADQGTAPAAKADQAAKKLPVFPEIAAQSQYGGQKGHMLELVRDELNQLGYSDEQIDGEGLRVTTTFTPKAMAAAQQGVLEARPDGFSDDQLHIAVASVQPGTGALRGFYGGQDYLKSQLNWAVTGGSPGSTFKAFALAAGLEDGFALKDTFDGNSPYYYSDTGTGPRVRNEGTGPDGLGNDYGSAVSLTTATEESINTAYADLTKAIGPQRVLDTANALGIPTWKRKSKDAYNHLDNSPGLEPVSGIALGSATVAPINMANAYASIANGGQAARMHVIEKVVDRNGETLWSWKQATKDAIGKDVAADTSYALQQTVQNGTGQAALALGRPAAGKTGTATNAAGDVSSAWFVGYTPQLSTAVMYVRGQGNGKLDGWLPSYFGADYPAETWTAVMRRDMEGVPVEEFPPPAFVDGTAPDSGHDPYTPPPSPTYTPPPTTSAPTTRPPSPSPTQKPTQAPTTQAPTTAPPSSAPPSPSAPPTIIPPPSDTSSPSPSPGGSPGPGNNGKGNGTGGGGNVASPGYHDRRWGYPA